MRVSNGVRMVFKLLGFLFAGVCMYLENSWHQSNSSLQYFRRESLQHHKLDTMRSDFARVTINHHKSVDFMLKTGIVVCDYHIIIIMMTCQS